jgi:hypothetical protein
MIRCYTIDDSEIDRCDGHRDLPAVENFKAGTKVICDICNQQWKVVVDTLSIPRYQRIIPIDRPPAEKKRI